MSHPRPVLVMIGGVACDETLWDDEVAALGDIADCRPILPAGDRIEEMAADILARIPGCFALVGHSMGGYVALAIQRATPERVTRLALIGSGANVESAQQREARLALMNLVRQKGYDALIDKLVPAMVGPDARRNAPMMARLEAMVRRAGAERFLRQQAAVMHRPEAQAALSHIKVPVIVLSGGDDRIVPPEFGAETARSIPNAEYHLLDRCGHIAPVESADAVATLLRNWLMQETMAPVCVAS